MLPLLLLLERAAAAAYVASASWQHYQAAKSYGEQVLNTQLSLFHFGCKLDHSTPSVRDQR